jgi:hypothetical protein
VLATETIEEGGFFTDKRFPDPADIILVCFGLISSIGFGDDDDKDSQVLLCPIWARTQSEPVECRPRWPEGLLPVGRT